MGGVPRPLVVITLQLSDIFFADRQWLELDLGPPTTVTGLVTRGRGDKKHWVTSYSMSYSNDSQVWYYYKDANHLEAKVSNGSTSQFHVSQE